MTDDQAQELRLALQWNANEVVFVIGGADEQESLAKAVAEQYGWTWERAVVTEEAAARLSELHHFATERQVVLWVGTAFSQVWLRTPNVMTRVPRLALPGAIQNC